MLDGVASPASVDRLGDGYVIGAGPVVLVVDGAGNETRIDGFGDAQGVAAVGTRCSWPTRHATSSCSSTSPPAAVTSWSPGRRSARRSAGAIVPAAFAAVAADGTGGYLVGCNGDGSIRRLTRTS